MRRGFCRRTRGLAVVAVTVAVAIAGTAGTAGATDRAAPAPRLEVAVAFYPLEWAVERIGGTAVRVRNLTPPGAEPHDVEMTTDDLDAVEDADLVVVLGGDFQPALEKSARRRDGAVLVVLDRLGVDADGDPHVWLDPVRMADLVDEVRRILVRVDPGGRDRYDRNATRLADDLAALDADYEAGLATCERRVLVTAHEAFGWLARRYHLREEGVTGLAPDVEPNPRRLAELVDLVRDTGITTVFTEELVSPKVAKALAREAGVQTAVLSPIEGLTDAQRRRGDDYESVMRRNLARLRRALSCT